VKTRKDQRPYRRRPEKSEASGLLLQKTVKNKQEGK
jgi:hypothetical protein